MKKLLSLALAAMMMVASASAVFAVDGKEVAPENAAKPKMWITSQGYDENYGGYVYFMNYAAGTDLTAITSSGFGNNKTYTGKAISTIQCAVEIDENVWDTSVIGGEGMNSLSGEVVNYTTYTDGSGVTHNVLSIEKAYQQTQPNTFNAIESDAFAFFVLVPKNAEGFDPAAVRLDILLSTMVIREYSASKYSAPVSATSYSNESTADYPITTTFGVEVLTTKVDGVEADEMIVAHTENVTGVTNDTEVVITYVPTSDTRTFSNLLDMLGAEGEGVAEGTVRFAVKCDSSLDPNGFLFKIN